MDTRNKPKVTNITTQGIMHNKDRKVIKLFQAITVLFLASFIPSLLLMTGITDSWFPTYAYFLNHFGNSVIYYFVDDEFRAEVLKNRIKCW